jgi:hypothetical protein
MITSKQQNWILAVVAILAMDAAVTIYGATFHNACFFEGNPIITMFGNNLSTVTNVIIATKLIAASIIVLATAYCNRNIGEDWGDAICQGSASVMGLWMVAMVGMNVWVNFVA